jgi:hypothetical protein
MIWQFMIVGAIVIWALVLTTIRLFRFFKTPVSKCGGCNGCALKDIKGLITK